MSRTQLASENLGDGLVKRADLNVNDTGSAVIRKLVAGAGVTISSTGADAGTGDVTLKLSLQDFLTTQFLTATGLSGGSSVMAVNGSVTPVPFWLPADATKDTYLDKIILVIESKRVDFALFGNLAALTTGFDLILKQGGVSVSLIDRAKTTYQLLKQSGADFDLLKKADATLNDGLIVRFQLDSPKLIAGSSDEIRAIVNDNLSTLSAFTARAFVRRLV